MKQRTGPKPTIPDELFIESWNRHGGDYRRVAEELKLKPNSVWQRGARLLRRHGVKRAGMYKTFNLNYEKLESEK